MATTAVVPARSSCARPTACGDGSRLPIARSPTRPSAPPWAGCSTGFADFMRLDRVAWDALQSGDPGRTKRILLGPEIRNFRAMAAATDRLADYEISRAAATDAEFDDTREDTRRRLIAVGLGAGVVIVLLLITANGYRPDGARGPARARQRRRSA